MKKRTIIGLVCGAIIIVVASFSISNMVLKSKPNSTNQTKEQTVATTNESDKEKAKLEEENKKLQEEKAKLENEKQKAENEKLKQENDKLKKEKENATRPTTSEKGNGLTPALMKGIESTVTGYVESFAEDVNRGYMGDGTYYDIDAPLYKKQCKVIPDLHNKRIQEYVENVTLDDIKKTGENTYTVKTTETISVSSPKGADTKDYHNTYIVKLYNGNDFRMYDIL